MLPQPTEKQLRNSPLRFKRVGQGISKGLPKGGPFLICEH